MPIKSDGTTPSGSRVLTIPTTTGASYIADNFNVEEPTQFLDNRDEKNEPNGGVLLEDFVTGSATLQLASSTTALPKNGDEFAEKIDPNDATATTFYLTHVGKPESRDSLQKVQIQFRKKYNAS
jgi:hypothetical protein